MRILITGASRGIGAAIARRFAKDGGAQIALLGRSHSAPAHESLNGTLLDVKNDVERLGSVAIPLQVDLTDAHALQCAIQTTVDAFDGLDVLVNNAGIRKFTHLTEATPESWQDIISVNLLGTANCAKAAMPFFRSAHAGRQSGSTTNFFSAST